MIIFHLESTKKFLNKKDYVKLRTATYQDTHLFKRGLRLAPAKV